MSAESALPFIDEHRVLVHAPAAAVRDHLPGAGSRGPHPLDNPAHSSLAGAHTGFAMRTGNVLRYAVDVSPFGALPARPVAADWADLAAAVGPGAVVPLFGVETSPPPRWEVLVRNSVEQLVDDQGVVAAEQSGTVRLTVADVPEMLALAERTSPGPFLSRTVELGTYLGVRHEGRLIAMAGERFRPPGWTEISAVCTDAAHRGHGIASRLVRALAHGIRQRGEVPFLHVETANRPARSLYERLGFRRRRTLTVVAVRAPGG